MVRAAHESRPGGSLLPPGPAFWLLCALLLLGAGGPVRAQGFSSTTFTEADGLPASECYDLEQTEDGLLWVATRNGLVAYDGLVWERQPLGEAFSRSTVRQLALDGEGRLWAATNHAGIFLLTEDGWEQTVEGSGALPVDRGISQFVVLDGTRASPLVALLTPRNGLLLHEGGEWTVLDRSTGLPSDTLTDLIGAGDDLLASCHCGLVRITPATGRIERLGYRRLGLPEPLVIGLLASRIEEGVIWIYGKSWMGKLREGRYEPVTTFPPAASRGSAHLGAMLEDGRGGLFFGLPRHSLYYTPDRGLQSFGVDAGLAANGFVAALRDREGIYWFATMRGLTKIPSLRFVSFHRDHGLLEDEVSAITQHPDGDLFFGHNGGFTRYDGSRFHARAFKRPIGLHQLRVMDLETDARGRVWLATSDLGVGLYRGDAPIRWYPGPDQETNQPTALLPRPDGSVVVATNGGLLLLRDGRYETITAERGRFVRNLVEGPEGRIWFTYGDKGIASWDGERVQRLRSSAEEFRAYCFGTVGDTLLVGAINGLFRVEGGRLLRHHVPGGPIERPVYFITSGEGRTCWIGTDRGIVRLDSSGRWEYTRDHGLAGSETNRDGGLLDRDGNLWVGTSEGLNLYRPRYDTTPAEAEPPVTRLRDLIANGDTLDPGEPAQLAYNSDITVHYRIVSFHDVEPILYRTSLQRLGVAGQLDTFLTESRSIHYSNLRHGRYLVSIAGRDGLGRWSDTVSTGTIQILPPFYLRLPFLLLLGAVLLITGLLVYRFVTMRRHEALLEHQVRERTAELHAMADRYHSMIQNAVFGIFRARPDGTLLAVNPALVRMLNYESEAELQQVDLVEEVFVSPERWRTLASTLDPGAELEGTAFRWKRRDGSVILVRLSGLVSQSSGEGPVLEMIAENVTELERNRAAALEAEKLRVARQVAVTVAHEFNNPLAVLLAAYDLHVRKLARTADRDTRERISAIPRAVERMRDLVNRLVTINRVREATYTGGTTFLNLNESSGEGEEDSPPPSADPE